MNDYTEPSTPVPTRPIWQSRAIWVVLGVFVIGTAAWVEFTTQHAAPLSRRFNVSQQGREFRPGMLDINRGDVAFIVNDDGDVSHHAYVATPGFSFDSGDQEPGGNVSIAFTQSGTFNVLCGIHPKMRLTVLVH